MGDMDKPMPFIELKIKDKKSDKEFEWKKEKGQMLLDIFYIEKEVFSEVLKTIEHSNTKTDFNTQRQTKEEHTESPIMMPMEN